MVVTIYKVVSGSSGGAKSNSFCQLHSKPRSEYTAAYYELCTCIDSASGQSRMLIESCMRLIMIYTQWENVITCLSRAFLENIISYIIYFMQIKSARNYLFKNTPVPPPPPLEIE